MKKLLKYLRGYKRECVLGPLFKLLEATFELFVPLVMASVIDRGINGGDTPWIWKMTGIMVALGIIGLVCAVTAQYFAAAAAVGFSSRLRGALFAHIQRLSFSKADKMGQAKMMTMLTSDINQLQNGVNLVLRLFLRSPFIVFGAAIMAFFVDAKAALVFLATIPLLSLIVFAIMLGGAPLYKRVQKNLDDILEKVRENITGVRVIRAFLAEGREEKKFEASNLSLMKKQLFAGKISALMNPLTYIVVNLSIVYILYAGAGRVYEGELTQGEVVALVNYMSQILVELVKLANLIITVTKAAACAARVSEALSDEEGLPMRDTVLSQNYKVEFKNVSLRYHEGGENSLQNISFGVKEGESVGIIGVTGSGKSSLVNMIPRFYEATEGTVFVDGKNVGSYDTRDLRKKIAVVPQKAQLFRGTIRSNVSFSGDVSDEDLLFAINTAQADDIVEAKGGLDAFIEQNGKNLSGGQKQRLTVARAIAARPEILILDDSGSALDYSTDLKMRESIAKIEGLTTFIVSQRASCVLGCDFIIVLEDGEIAGIGKHDELLKSCPVYEEIYYSQFERGEGA